MNNFINIIYPWIPAIVVLSIFIGIVGYISWCAKQNRKKLAKMAAERNTVLERFNAHR
jgi:hypothetical protein